MIHLKRVSCLQHLFLCFLRLYQQHQQTSQRFSNMEGFFSVIYKDLNLVASFIVDLITSRITAHTIFGRLPNCCLEQLEPVSLPLTDDISWKSFTPDISWKACIWPICSSSASLSRLGVVNTCLFTHLRRHTNMVIWASFSPDITWDTCIRSILTSLICAYYRDHH